MTFSTMQQMQLFKFVMLGDACVGKTQLICKFKNGTFSPYYWATIGTDFSAKKFVLPDSVVSAQIWDTAGDQRLQGLSDSHLRNVDVFVVAFDMANRKSFNNVQEYIMTVKLASGAKNMPRVIIIGTKSDLPNEDRKVSAQDIEKLKATYPDYTFIETSAKNNIGLDDVFIEPIKSMLKSRGNIAQPNVGNHTISPETYLAARDKLVKIFRDYQDHLKRENNTLMEFDKWLNQHMDFIKHKIAVRSGTETVFTSLEAVMFAIGDKQSDKVSQYRKYNDPSAPLSVRMDQALQYIHDILIEHEKARTKRTPNEKEVLTRLEIMLPTMRAYVKLRAADELQSVLETGAPKQAITQFNKQLKEYDDLFEFNRQSGLERGLKWAAVLSIILLVGIIPTIILMIKRSHDSDGKRWNFFRPLSADIKDHSVGILRPMIKNRIA